MIFAILVSVIWGLAFVATKIGLDSFSAPQLTVLRFLIACVPALFVPRPQISWSLLIVIGLTLFTGQFLFLFFAYKAGIAAGLAAVTQQTQAFFTVILATIFLREIPTFRQSAGLIIAFAGLIMIGLTVGADLPLLAFGLAIASALSWAIGNILVKRIGNVQMFPLMVWLSLVPPLPALAVSVYYDGNSSLLGGLAEASWSSIAAAIYLGAVATAFAYAIWGNLLNRYPAAMVVPFALISPCVGVIASSLAFGEVFGPARYAGMALIFVGLAVIVLPFNWARFQR
ncbi:MAG: EamA family transporter [Proteobacteria bacterium]|nr:EamA family transporter [Pseudomonadota bacterium]